MLNIPGTQGNTTLNTFLLGMPQKCHTLTEEYCHKTGTRKFFSGYIRFI